MPLHRHHKVSRRVEFDGFNHAILRRNRAHQQVVPGDTNRLVVAGVDLDFGPSLRQQLSQPGSGRDVNRVRLNNVAAGPVIDGGIQILNERPVAPDIEALRAVADGEDWFVQIESILEDQFVNRRTRGIVFSTLRNARLSVPLGVDIEAAAR